MISQINVKKIFKIYTMALFGKKQKFFFNCVTEKSMCNKKIDEYKKNGQVDK